MGGLPANRTVNGFAIDPTNSKVMYVAMRDGLFKSKDAGASWKPLGKELKNMAAVTVNPKKPAEVYAVISDGVMFRSVDAGMRWERER